MDLSEVLFDNKRFQNGIAKLLLSNVKIPKVCNYFSKHCHQKNNSSFNGINYDNSRISLENVSEE